MSFGEFLGRIFSIFPSITIWANNILGSLMQNYIFMIIIYTGLIILSINIILSIIEIIKEKTAPSKDKEK